VHCLISSWLSVEIKTSTTITEPRTVIIMG